MRYLLIILALAVTSLNAQTALNFNKRFVECENKWVAFEMNKDSTYTFGFIYIDTQAGLTFNNEGTFSISPSGEYIAKKSDQYSIKVRLQPKSTYVALIPETKFDELKIQPIPDWLKYYKTDTNSVERLYRMGYIYNEWNECAKALTFLERGKMVNPKFDGLDVELAFSYNCLNQFDKAFNVLDNALKNNPTDAYLNKELIYSLIQLGQIDKAAETCKTALTVCKDNTYNGENCYNLAYNFFLKKDKQNFILWKNEAKKWLTDNSQYYERIKSMEKVLLK